MTDEPETPGAVFADALQQWREALRGPPRPDGVRAPLATAPKGPLPDPGADPR